LKVGEDKLKRGRVLQLYLAGVVGSLDDKEVISCLRDITVHISLEERQWTRDHVPVLKESVKLLCKTPERKADILQLYCQQMGHHKAPAIRQTVITIITGIIPQLNTQELLSKVIPYVSSLNTDTDRVVQTASIMAYASLITSSPDLSVINKVQSLLEPLCEETNNHNVKCDVVRALAAAIPAASADFRDTFALPHLAMIVEENAKNVNNKERREIAKFVFEGIRLFSGARGLEHELIIGVVLPLIKMLLNEADGFEPSYRSFLTQMFSEMEGLTKVAPPTQEETGRASGGFTNERLKRGLFNTFGKFNNNT